MYFFEIGSPSIILWAVLVAGLYVTGAYRPILQHFTEYIGHAKYSPKCFFVVGVAVLLCVNVAWISFFYHSQNLLLAYALEAVVEITTALAIMLMLAASRLWRKIEGEKSEEGDLP